MNCLSRNNNVALFASKKVDVFIVGTSGSGKTTVFNRIKEKEGGIIQYYVREVGESMAGILREGKFDARILAFVVDSSDMNMISEAKILLRGILEHILSSEVFILVLANKQDKEGCMDITEIVQNLQLDMLVNWRIHIQQCSAVNGEGIYAGLQSIYNK